MQCGTARGFSQFTSSLSVVLLGVEAKYCKKGLSGLRSVWAGCPAMIAGAMPLQAARPNEAMINHRGD